MSTLVYYRSSPEAERSPELADLRDLVRHQLRLAFGECRLVPWSAEAPVELPRSDEVDPQRILILASPNLLVREPSLRALARRLDQGAPGAVTTSVAEAFRPSTEPIYTVRGFERFEASWLGEESDVFAPASSHLPVALFDGVVFRRRAEEIGLAAVLNESDAFASRLAELQRAGVHHEFIDYYGEVRSDILAYLPERLDDVLEVGCGRGLTGALIQERRHCRVTGIELNPAVAAEAEERLHQVLVGDVETIEIPGGFDAVVATELFEHLNYPRRFLAKVRRCLRPGGRIVLSVPNVGHWSVVEDLLAGRWDYLPIGLLCFTHFRFFTRRTLEDWLRREGFERFTLVPQKTELPERFLVPPAGFETDAESLATKGFYVLIESDR